MKTSIISTLTLLALAPWSFAAEQEHAPAAKPNIILVLSDDHGWRDSGCYGNKDVRTPNMDKLAAEGMRFTRAFAASPLCSPSRCVIETGLMPCRNGGHVFGGQIHAGITTLPVYFKRLGYYTAELGKIHHPSKDPKAFPYDRLEKGKSAAAAAFIKSYKGDKPLLLVVSLDWIPHTPWPKNTTYDPATFTLPPNFVDTPETRADLANYYTGVTKADTMLGDVMKALDESKLRDNTLLIYTTDQGANLPFAKWCVYDSGLRVPFIVRWPGRAAAGSVTDAMVSFADLVPAFIDVAGGKPPASLDGRSFLKVLTGETKQHRDVVFGTHTRNGSEKAPELFNDSPGRTIITPRYQYVLNLKPQVTFRTHITGCRPGNPHYLPLWDSWVEKAKTDKFAAQIVNAYQHRPREELYDLQADPYEMHNLVNDPKLAEQRRVLRKQLATWCQQQGDTEPLKHLKP